MITIYAPPQWVRSIFTFLLALSSTAHLIIRVLFTNMRVKYTVCLRITVLISADSITTKLFIFGAVWPTITLYVRTRLLLTCSFTTKSVVKVELASGITIAEEEFVTIEGNALSITAINIVLVFISAFRGVWAELSGIYGVRNQGGTLFVSPVTFSFKAIKDTLVNIEVN